MRVRDPSQRLMASSLPSHSTGTPSHAQHMGDSGLILVVTGEVEVPVKVLVGSMITCSGMTCSVRSVRHITVYLQQKFNVVGFALIYVIQTVCTHSNAYKCGYMDSMQQQHSWLTTSRLRCTLPTAIRLM